MPCFAYLSTRTGTRLHIHAPNTNIWGTCPAIMHVCITHHTRYDVSPIRMHQQKYTLHAAQLHTLNCKLHAHAETLIMTPPICIALRCVCTCVQALDWRSVGDCHRRETYGAAGTTKFTTKHELTYILDEGIPWFLIKTCDKFAVPWTRFKIQLNVSYEMWKPGDAMPVNLIDKIAAKLALPECALGAPRTTAATAQQQEQAQSATARPPKRHPNGPEFQEPFRPTAMSFGDSLSEVCYYEDYKNSNKGWSLQHCRNNCEQKYCQVNYSMHVCDTVVHTKLRHHTETTFICGCVLLCYPVPSTLLF